MQSNTAFPLDIMFQYNLWANRRLIELCGALSEQQLALEVDGVFGRVQPTLAHIVRSEGYYLSRLTGTKPWADDIEWESLSIADLLDRARLSGTQLIEIADKVDPDLRHDGERQGKPFHYFNWTVLLQALYHGIEHRTQIKIVLTQLGVDHPELSAWDYMDGIR